DPEIRSVFPKYKFTIWLIVVCLALSVGAYPTTAQVLPLEQENTITANWLVYKNNTNELVPYVEGDNTDKNAIHQWLQVSPEKPFRISFVAPEGLSLFLNNQLVFVADSTAEYKVDLTPLTQNIEATDGSYLLTVWHPEQRPLVRSFRNARVQVPVSRQSSQPESGVVPVKREVVNQSAFILFVLIIGLLYGALRSSYPADFRRLFEASSFMRPNATMQGAAL